MSCQALQRREQYDHQALNSFVPKLTGNVGSFAEWVTAFDKSNAMLQFESNLRTNNPLYGEKVELDEDMHTSPKSPQIDKINSNLEECLKNARDQSATQATPIVFPLTRQQYYPPNQMGTELLE